jgi:hypothetical protein
VSRVSHGPDRLNVTFDDEGLMANAGLLLVATVSARLGISRIVAQTVRMGGLVGGALPGRKVLSLVHAIVAGASHIDRAGILRRRRRPVSSCPPPGRSWSRRRSPTCPRPARHPIPTLG